MKLDLKSKFKNAIEDCGNDDYDGVEHIANLCVAISDEITLGFAEWIIYQDITVREKGVFVNQCGETKTYSDLLEIYKSTL